MRILLSTDNVGGVWSYSLALTRALAVRGAVVDLAVIGPPLDGDARAELEDVPHEGLFSLVSKLEWMDDPWSDVARSGRWLQDLARSRDPDVVHLCSYSHAALTFPAPVVLVAHSCIASWWEACKAEPLPPRYVRYRRRVEAGLRGADVVVAPTAAMMRALLRHYSFDTPCATIHNATDLPVVAAPPRREIVGVGRLWDEAKNLGALARAAPGLQWPVRLAGEAARPDGPEVEPAGVELLGKLGRAELAPLLSGAAVFCEPALYEPFGLAALEAARCRCALVLGDIPSLREVWGEAAVYANPRDDDGLREALTRLIQDDDLRTAMQRAAACRAGRYTLDRLGRDYLALYEDVVSGYERVPSRGGAA